MFGSFASAPGSRQSRLPASGQDERDRAAGEALAGYLTPANKRKSDI
jgi:hypothetical protein